MLRRSRRPALFLAAPLAVLAMAAVAGACGADTSDIPVGLSPVDQPVDGQAGGATDGPSDRLTPCDELSPLAVEQAGEPTGRMVLDQRVLTVLADYGAGAPETFAGLWLDARYGGAPIIAFTDDPEPHRAALIDRLSDSSGRNGGSGGVPFGIVLAGHTQNTLTEARDRLLGDDRVAGDVLRGAAIDRPRNRVAIDLVDPHDDDLAHLTEVVPAGLICARTTIGPPVPDGPLDVLPRGGRAELLSCGEFSFPASALDDPVPIAAVDHPAAALVVESAGADRSAADAWIVLELADGRATFGKLASGIGSGSAELEATVEATTGTGRWEITGWSFGCELRVGLPRGLGAVEMFLDPATVPAENPSDSRFTVLVAELACAGGAPMGERLLGPQVIEHDDRVVLAFAAVALPGEPAACPGNTLTPIEVRLDRPLGGRTVMNGLTIPPRPLREP